MASSLLIDLDPSEVPDPKVSDRVSPEQICGWIRECQQSHGPRCNDVDFQIAGLVSGLKLIDVVDHCIVESPPNAHYFALSYVWGGVTQLHLTTQNYSDFLSKDSLRHRVNEIPTVICNAIQFVHSCGRRYLWVDSLCIVQDNTKLKYSQIKQMAAIYNGAVATLVAPEGVNANQRLPGVGPGSRSPEDKKLRYHEVYLINPGLEQYTSLRKPQNGDEFVRLGRRLKPKQLDLFEQLESSPYHTRGWTMQEQFLSRRCIYFMSNMVYFHCRRCIRAENKTTPYTHDSQQIRSLSLYTSDPIFSGDVLQLRGTLGAIYASIVKLYTRRKLSHPEDILSAFAGTSAALETILSCQTVAGIPDNLIDYALLWKPSMQPELPRLTQAKTPTWSWAGWQGQVDYEEIIRIHAGYEPYLADSISLIESWMIRDQNGIRKVPSALHIPDWVKSQRSVLPALDQEWESLQKKVDEGDLPETILIFQAFTLPAGRNEILRLSKYKEHKRFAPSFSSTDILKQHLSCSSTYELVFLSTSKSLGSDLTVKWTGIDSHMNVMLVKRTGHFSERVLLGLTRSLYKWNGQEGFKSSVRVNRNSMTFKTVYLI